MQHVLSLCAVRAEFAIAAALPQSDGWSATLPWLAGLVVLSTAAGAFGVWSIVSRLRDFEALGKGCEALEEIRLELQRLAKERGDLDLRRIEHVLIELRDGQRRLEDSILRSVQSAPRAGGAEGVAEVPADPGQRIIARVLAHGFERVQIAAPRDEIERLVSSEGLHEVLVEARRNGVLCKGRVLLRDGVVTDVELTPAYTMFP